MKICYREIKFKPESLNLIHKVNEIINKYISRGYSLSLRQVYYQLVAQEIIPNVERSYKNLSVLISDARISGLIDWDAIEDRTRNLRGNSHWNSARDMMYSAAHSFAYDKWADQDYHVEVWVETDALVGIVGSICGQLDVSYFSCRGYVSQSEMWVAAQRLVQKYNDGKETVVIHLGDHDPSGIDMSRDIEDRLNTFNSFPLVRRVALNMDQIEEYLPPPNPTKLKDTRATGYIAEFGYECWELDALDPEVMEEIIETNVLEFLDIKRFDAAAAREKEEKKTLRKVADQWDDIKKRYA